MAENSLYWLIQPYLGMIIGWALIGLAIYGLYRLVRNYFKRS